MILSVQLYQHENDSKSYLNVKYFTQKTVVLAVVSALMFIVGGFLVKEYKINALGKKEYRNVKR